MAEGTTIAPSVRCSLCDEDDAIKLCNDCYQELCSRCSKAHAKLQSTSHHKLTPIENKGIPGARPKSTKAYCSEHTSTPLSIICEKCMCALCVTCADQDHTTHRLIQTNLDVTLLQRISAEKVPEFMKLLHQLEKQKDGAPKKLELYKSARDFVQSSRDRVWKIIEQDSEKLLKQIDKEIKHQETLLTNIEEGMKDVVQSTDRQMAVMSNARKINDPGALMSNIHDGDQVIKRAKLLLDEIESTRTVYTIDDLLPFRHELNSMEKGLHTFFTMTPLADEGSKDKETMLTYLSMTKIESHSIGKGGQGRLRISESSQRNPKALVIYRVNEPDICVFDLESKIQTKFRCSKCIYRMATLTRDRHIAIEGNLAKNLHILDENFSILSSLSGLNTAVYKPWGVCAMSSNTCIISESYIGLLGKGKTRFREVTAYLLNKSNVPSLIKTTLFEANLTEGGGILSPYTGQKQLAIATSPNQMSTVDLKTGQNMQLDLNIHGKIYYLCVDKTDQILVGDTNGGIHLATSSQYICELQNMRGTGDVGGISIRGDNVIVVEGEYLHIYK